MNYLRLFFALLPLTLPSAIVSAAPAAAPTLTGPVMRVDIAGLKNVPEAVVRAKLTLKPGDPYTPEAAGKDAAALQSLGVFLKGTVKPTAAPDPKGGVDLTYTVAENPIIQSIQITANTPTKVPSIPAAELLAQMKTHVGQVLDTNVLVHDLDALFNHTDGFALKQGRLYDVSTDITIDPKTGVLTIPLVEYRIKSINVTGNRRVKTADILAQMHTKVGSIYNGVTINEDVSDIYEIGSFRAVTYTYTSTDSGSLNINLSVVEQAPATGTLDEKQGKIIPFLYDPPTIPFSVIQVSVNGKPPLPFILDTGTSYPLSLDPWAVKQLGLSASGAAGKTDHGVPYTRIGVHGVILLGAKKSDNAVFDTREALVLDLSLLTHVVSGQRVAGIVGLGMLLPVTSRFDFAAKTLTVFTAPHPPLHVPGGFVLPLRGASGFLTARATLAPNTYADLIIDTGSTSTQIPISALSALPPTAQKYDGVSARLDGAYLYPTLRLTALKLGSISVPNVVAGTLPPQTRLSLGMDVLTDYRLTLDAPNGQLIMEPITASERYPRGHSGVGVSAKPDGSGWVISDLESNSPAKAAGLQVSDKLMTVAGKSVQGLTDTQVGKLFAVRLGSPLAVTVQRGGATVPLTWVPIDEFSAAPSAIDGLPMQKAPGGSWVISEVVKGCPGDKAGLQAGDRLIRIGGEATAAMALGRFAELTGKPPLVFEVERAGTAKPFSVTLTAPK